MSLNFVARCLVKFMFNAKTQQPIKSAFFRADIFIICASIVLGIGLINFHNTASSPYLERVAIDVSLESIPGYALLSMMRSLIALVFSYVFAIVYGGLAARNKTWERILIPLLDVFQSLPVVAFLPGFVLGMISLFHYNRWGIEIAVLLTIFTGQVWNLAFAYYEAQKTLQSELNDVADIYKLSKIQRFFYINLPNAYPQLIYNGMMSMAGGWFFITTCEAFTLGNREFLAPGIGSYISATFASEMYLNFSMGIIVLTLMILGTNFLIWRPLVRWSSRFQTMDENDGIPKSIFLDTLSEFLKKFFMVTIDRVSLWFSKPKLEQGIFLRKSSFLIKLLGPVCLAAFIFYLLPKLPSLGQSMMLLTNVDWFHIMAAVLLTGLKVLIVLTVASLWTIPVGIWLGLNPKTAKFLQPAIQNLASFPAPVLFPLIILFLAQTFPPFVNATILMIIGCQWYILFNAVSGASRISADLKLVTSVYQFSVWQKFKFLYFPAIFPSLVTGWITAAGGAWNASMVAEVVHYPGGIMRSSGIGAEMAEATAMGNYPKLVASIICVVIVLVVINRSVWYTLYEYAERAKE